MNVLKNIYIYIYSSDREKTRVLLYYSFMVTGDQSSEVYYPKERNIQTLVYAKRKLQITTISGYSMQMTMGSSHCCPLMWIWSTY